MIELVIVIVVIGILAAVASSNMNRKIETARYDTAKTEMEQIAFAIAGNPALHTEGSRSDFGYIGDIGAAPDSLGDLVGNYHGSVRWDGPYLDIASVPDYNFDPWNVRYVLNDTAVISIGSGDSLTREFALSRNALFGNRVSGFVRDANGDPPGNIYNDSLVLVFIYPDGTGGLNHIEQYPDRKGYFSLNNLPIGNHRLLAIYLPDSDSTVYPLSVNPGNDLELNIVLPADLW